MLAKAHAGHPDAALRLADRARPALYGAMLRGEVAAILLAQGRDADALRTGREAWRRADGALAQPAYVAGLAAWRAGDAAAAAILFQAAALAPLATPEARAAAPSGPPGTRSAAHDPPAAAPGCCAPAAAAPAGFYGLLARAGLGLDEPADPPDDARALPGEADLDAIATLPAGRRAFALLQIGEPDRARAEFRLLWPQLEPDPSLRRALLLTLRAAALPDLADQFASLLPGAPPPAAAHLPTLAPRGGFTIDPAMVYGLARVESNFDPAAISGAGARGLMQIMPLTAGFIAGEPSRYAGRPARLHDPALNLQLGQKYVRYLAESGLVHGDLLRLLASYNAGPGSTARWSVDDRGDPLLFIEAIPLDETRHFVQSVLAYTWIYAARMRLPSPTRAALAAGAWPQFDRGALH